MKIGILGSGNIGGALGRTWAAAGHTVMFSGSRDQAKLEGLAQQAGHGASWGTLEEAAAFGEVVLLALLVLTVVVSCQGSTPAAAVGSCDRRGMGLS